MKSTPPKLLRLSFLALAAGFALAASTTSHAQTLLLDLKASNYNNTTGVWTDSGSTNTATGPTGLLALNSTPNGSSTVAFNNSVFTLATALPVNASYTAFVFLKPSASTGAMTFFGGDGGSFQYRLNQGKQDVVQQAQSDLGSSGTTLSSTSFSTIDVTAGSAGGAFRLNGTADGTIGGGNFSHVINYIGSNGPQGANGGETFTGNIAEIEIYSGVLTTAQIQTVEGQFTASYAVPEPGTWATALIGVGSLLGLQRFRTRKA